MTRPAAKKKAPRAPAITRDSLIAAFVLWETAQRLNPQTFILPEQSRKNSVQVEAEGLADALLRFHAEATSAAA